MATPSSGHGTLGIAAEFGGMIGNRGGLGQGISGPEKFPPARQDSCRGREFPPGQAELRPAERGQASALAEASPHVMLVGFFAAFGDRRPALPPPILTPRPAASPFFEELSP